MTEVIGLLLPDVMMSPAAVNRQMNHGVLKRRAFMIDKVEELINHQHNTATIMADWPRRLFMLFF